MKTKKIFIPNGATACLLHQSIDNWNVNVLKQRNKFTPDKIKEIIDLLCNVKPNATLAESSLGKTYKKWKRN